MNPTGKTKLPAIQEVTNTAKFQKTALFLQPGSRGFQLGRCSIIVSPPYLDEGWHISISHPDRYPTRDEVVKARYELVPDEAEMVMRLPPKADYVNIHENCFQLKEVVK